MPTALYLDDLAVGRKFITRETTLTLEGCKAFAADFDPQPFHLDEAVARHSLFGRLAASGWYTASVTMRLIVDSSSRSPAASSASAVTSSGRSRPIPAIRYVSNATCSSFASRSRSPTAAS
jgi:acyl dehydratase